MARFANEAIGSSTPWVYGKVERLRLAVVWDWAVRWALPLWVERHLPLALNPTAEAEHLRTLRPLIYSTHAIEALAAVHSLYVQTLPGTSLDRRRGDRSCETIVDKLMVAREGLSFVVARWCSEACVDDVDYVFYSRRALRLVLDEVKPLPYTATLAQVMAILAPRADGRDRPGHDRSAVTMAHSGRRRGRHQVAAAVGVRQRTDRAARIPHPCIG